MPRRPPFLPGLEPVEPRVMPSAVAYPTSPAPDFSGLPPLPASPADAPAGEPGDPPVSNPTVPVGPALPAMIVEPGDPPIIDPNIPVGPALPA